MKLGKMQKRCQADQKSDLHHNGRTDIEYISTQPTLVDGRLAKDYQAPRTTILFNLREA